MAKGKTVTGIAVAAFLAGGTGGVMVSQDNYAEGVKAKELTRPQIEKTHIDSTLAGIDRNVQAGDRLDNITMLNGKIIIHSYHTFTVKPHAPSCIKTEIR